MKVTPPKREDGTRSAVITLGLSPAPVSLSAVEQLDVLSLLLSGTRVDKLAKRLLVDWGAGGGAVDILGRKVSGMQGRISVRIGTARGRPRKIYCCPSSPVSGSLNGCRLYSTLRWSLV